MSCLFKNHITSFGLFCLLFLSVLVSFCLGTNNVFAVEDRSVIIDLNTAPTSGTPLFSDCDSTCLSQYTYIKIEFSDDSVVSNFRFGFNSPSYNSNVALPSVLQSTVFSIDNLTSIYYYVSYTTNNSVTVTLTDSLCPACPDPEPVPDPEDCPEVPDNPYDQKLDNITQAIYVATASLLVIYFFYCIYRMIIKGVKQ